jgi:MFS family permease
MLVLGVTPFGLFSLAVAAMFVVGSCAAVANGCIAAVFQATIAPEYQGRVFTLMASVATAMTPVGLLLATPIADLAGVRAWYVVGGIACALLGGAAFLVRPILEMEGPPAGADASDADGAAHPTVGGSPVAADRTARVEARAGAPGTHVVAVPPVQPKSCGGPPSDS